MKAHKQKYTDFCKEYKEEIKEFEEDLVNKYKFYQPIHFPFAEYPIGWCEIVQEALMKLSHYSSKIESLKVIQIKEKFGGLRVYRSHFTADMPEELLEEIDEVIMEAERQADSTCVACGFDARWMSKSKDESWIYGPMCTYCKNGFSGITAKGRIAKK
jgi:hypothetical protein